MSENLIFRHPLFLYHGLNDCLIADNNFIDADFFLLVEIKTEHLAFVFMICIQVINQLLFSAFVIFITVPYFSFYDKLFAAVIHDHISSAKVSCL